MSFTFDPALWPPQLRSIEAAIDAMDRGSRVCLYSPTGSGKTKMAGELLRWVESQGLGGVFYVNRKLLIQQTVDRFMDLGLDVGIRAADFDDQFDPNRPIQVASADTEASRVYKKGKWTLHDVGKGGLIVVDEAHIQKSKVMKNLLYYYREQGARILLLTATPVEMGEWADELVVGGKLSEWRACGALVPVYPFSISQPDMRKVKRNVTGEYVLDDRKRRVFMQHIVGEVIENWERLNDGSPTMMYAPGVPESRWLVQQFSDRGHRFAHVDATTCVVDGVERKLTTELWEAILQEVRSGELKGISSRFKCLDMQTEVLTATGWAKRDEISMHDLVASVDEFGVLTWQKPTRIVDTFHDGNFAVWKNDSVDIRVTDDHTMVVRSQDKRCKLWKKTAAIDLASRKSNYQIPVAGTESARDLPLTDHQVSLLGWMMTDGHFGKDGRWSITQSTTQPDYIHQHIRDTLASCGVEFQTCQFTPSIDGKQYSPAIRYTIPKSDVPKTGVAGVADKDFSVVLLSLSRRQLEVLLYAINLADGSKRKSPTWEQKTLEIGKGNATFLSRLQALCVSRGMRANLHLRADGCYMLYVTPQRDYANVRGCTNSDNDNHSRLRVRLEKSAEPVWCLTVPGGTLVTRRNGKVAVVGNCREGIDLPMAGHCVLATPVGSIASYLQICGRVMRAAKGKTQAVLQDHGGCYHLHGSPNHDRAWDILWKMKEGVASANHQDAIRNGEIPEPIRCYKCGMERATGPKCPSCGTESSKSVREIRMENGSLERIEGDLIKPPRRVQKPDTETLWAKMFWGFRKKGVDMSFAQLEGYFHRTHGYLPPRNLPLMPMNRMDWKLKPKDIDLRALHDPTTSREAKDLARRKASDGKAV